MHRFLTCTDGIIICPTQQREENVRYLVQCGIPFVLVGRHFPDIETDYVACDDELGGYLATRELISHGHTRILLLNGPAYITSARKRLAGYRRALREANIPLSRGLVHEIGLTLDGCEKAADDICSGRHRCTAAFVFSDLIALGLWASLRKRGVRVPEDCSLVGFDGIQTRLSSPFTLTSVAYLSEGMGETAVDMLVGRINGERAKLEGITIVPKLAHGDTVARNRKKAAISTGLLQTGE